MLNRLSFVLVILFHVGITYSVRAQEILTNQSILNMHQNRVSSSIIVDKIRTSRSGFDLSTPGLIQLLTAKVSDSVIEAMMIGTKMTDVLTNTDIIQLREANMSLKLITQKINNSRTLFDLSTNGLIQLKNGKVPDAIQKIMMAAPSEPSTKKNLTSTGQPASHYSDGNDTKGVRCQTWTDKFTKKRVTMSKVILRGTKASNILLGRGASTLAGVEDMEITLVFRRDNRSTVLVLYAMKPGVHKLLVEQNKTLMFLMDDDSVMEFKPIIDSEYGLNVDYGSFNVDSKLCVYYAITEEQLRALTKKMIKNYRLNTYNRHTNDDTVNQARAEQVQVAAQCILGGVPAIQK